MRTAAFTWLLATSLPMILVAARDMRLNWHSDDADIFLAATHLRSRSAGMCFAIGAPLLCQFSIVMAFVFWVMGVVFTFVLVPNRVLDEKAPKTKARR